MLDPGLRRECEEAIRAGSKSFLAASMLLPGSTRSAARALYAFCRAADDLIDESADPAEGLSRSAPGSTPSIAARRAAIPPTARLSLLSSTTPCPARCPRH